MDSIANVHANYTLQTLLYVSSLAVHGEHPTLRRMGLRDEQITRFRELSMEDAADLARVVATNLVSLSFDAAAIDIAIKNVARHRSERDLIYQMVRCGAPISLMTDLFGLNCGDYAHCRQALGLEDDAGGRPRKPSDDIQRLIWTSWQQHRSKALPYRYLAVHEESGETIRVIHALLRDWESSGSPFEGTGVSGKGRVTPS